MPPGMYTWPETTFCGAAGRRPRRPSAPPRFGPSAAGYDGVGRSGGGAGWGGVVQGEAGRIGSGRGGAGRGGAGRVGLNREFKRTVRAGWMAEWLATRKIFYTFVGADFIPTGPPSASRHPTTPPPAASPSSAS